MKKLASKLEEEFQASEQARLQAEENKRRQQAGTPRLLEADKPAKKEPSPEVMNALTSFIKEAIETQVFNKIMYDLIIQIRDSQEEIKSQNRELLDKLARLLTEKDKVADLQIETLTKLNKYLDNWL